MTDVKLDHGSDGSWILVEGRVVKVVGSDLMLDSPVRRKQSRGFRRALVHDASDGLTINFNNDYPGGVTINDVRALKGRVTLGKALVTDGMSIRNVSEIAGVVRGEVGASEIGKADSVPSLVLRGDVLIERTGPLATKVDAAPVSLQSMFSEMQTRIAGLEEQLDTLRRELRAAKSRTKAG